MCLNEGRRTRARRAARHGILATMVTLLTACGAGGEQAASPVSGSEGDVLHVYNFADYIGESTIRDFETRTGVRVSYDVYDSNELLSTKLLTGNSGYDVVFPSGWYIRRDLPAGDSWAAVFDPAVASRLAGCGIAMLDSGGDMLSLAKLHLGLDMNSQAPADFAAAKAVLMGVRPHVRYFDSSRYVSDLATGEICVAVGWVNGVHQARTRGAEAATPVAVVYSIPKEGAPVWFDFMAIPVDTPNPDQAHAFLNYMMEPEVIAAVTNVVGQPNGNTAALQFVDRSIRDDPSLYPTADVMQRLHTYAPYSDDYIRQINRAWTEIKSGR